jgi:glycosyltransferase involved in cell wall biosynthesis
MNHLVTMYDYEVYMLTTDQGNHPVPYELNESVHLEDLGIRLHQQYLHHGIKRWLVLSKLLWSYKCQLKDRISKISPDVIVCTTSNYWDINIISQVKGSIPLVVESHSIYKQTLGEKGIKSMISYYMYKRGLLRSQMIVALTERDAEEWRKHYDHVCVIPNFVHLNDLPCAALKEKRAIWVGRLALQKCPIEIIEIWKMVYEKYPDWRLEMYGEGELYQEVNAAICSLDMNIHLHQPTKHIMSC